MKKFQESTQLKTDIGKEIIGKTQIPRTIDIEQGKVDLMEQAGILLNKSREKIVENVSDNLQQVADSVNDKVEKASESVKKASDELNEDLNKKL